MLYLAVLALLAARASGAIGSVETDPSLGLFELNRQYRTWTVEDGLPEKLTGPLVVSPEGQLWVGTLNEVIRFNGYRFQTVGGEDGPLTGLNVGAMVQDHQGHFWVLGRSGKLVEVIGDQFVVHRNAGAPLGGAAQRLAVAPDGVVHLFVANPNEVALFAWRNERLERLGGQSLPGHYPLSFAITDDGRVWGTFRSIGPFEFREGRFEKLDLPVKGRGSSVVFRRFSGQYALAGTAHLMAYHDGEWRLAERFARPVPNDAEITCASEDADGTLWLGTSYRGLWARPAEASSPARVHVPSNPDAVRFRYLAADSQGNVWSTGIGGMVQFYCTPFNRWPAPESFRNAELFSVAEDGQGEIWLCGYSGIFRLGPNGMFEGVPSDIGRKSLRVIAGRREGGVWVGEYGAGIWLNGPGGVERIASTPRGGIVANIVDLGNEESMVASSRGLSRIRSRQAEILDPFGPGSGASVRHLTKGPGGTVHAMHEPFGLSRWRNGEWERLTVEDGSNGAGQEFVVDSDEGVWVSFQDGRLGWWRMGSWKETSRETLGIPAFLGLTADDFGGLWLRTESEGLLRFNRLEIERYLLDHSAPRPVPVRFGGREGVVGRQNSIWNNGLLVDSRERVWFASRRGALVLDSRAWKARRERARPTAPVIEEVQIEEQIIPVLGMQRSPVVLDPGTDRFAVSFAIPDFINPEHVTYRYRLRGYDEGWIEAGNRRTAFYQRLPPGEYLFEVGGTNSLGLACREPATLAVVMRPHFWQRRTFHAGMALALLGLVFWFHRVRMRHFQRQQAVQHEFSRRLIQAQEQERKRISAELHDSLGQNLTVVKNRLTLQQMETGEENGNLKDVADLVALTIEDTRRISRNLRPYVLDRIGLTRAINEVARQIEEATGLRIEARIENIDNLFSDENQINLYRVVQECLNNVLKHADASRVSLAIRRREREVVLRIEDDGRGFEVAGERPPVAVAGGMGLSGIKERLRIMGGTVEWISARRQGVKVIATIPIIPTDERND